MNRKLKKIMLLSFGGLIILIWFGIAWPSYYGAKMINKMVLALENMNKIKKMVNDFEKKTKKLPRNGNDFGDTRNLWEDLKKMGIVDNPVKDFYSKDGSYRYYNFVEKFGHPVNLKGDVEYEEKLKNVEWILVSCGPDGIFNFNPEKELKVYEVGPPGNVPISQIKGDIYFTKWGKLERYTYMSPTDKNYFLDKKNNFLSKEESNSKK